MLVTVAVIEIGSWPIEGVAEMRPFAVQRSLETAFRFLYRDRVKNFVFVDPGHLGAGLYLDATRLILKEFDRDVGGRLLLRIFRYCRRLRCIVVALLMSERRSATNNHQGR